MASIKLICKEEGLFLKDPVSDQAFILGLKQTLSQLGLNDFDDASIQQMFQGSNGALIRIADGLPSSHDAYISFEISAENSDQLLALIIPPNNGKFLSKEDILQKIKESGFKTFSPDLKAVDILVEKQKKEITSFSLVIAVQDPPETQVSVNANKMEASLVVIKYENQYIQESDLMKALEDAGVIRGIRKEIIREILRKNSCPELRVVARGADPIPGDDATITYYFDAFKQKLGPQIDDQGRADFHSLGTFENVKEGAVLCEITEPTVGMPGYNVLGEVIPAKPGIELALPQGQNTAPDPANKKRLIATKAGIPKIVDKKVIIDPVLNIKDGVGVSTGDVNFVGVVNITGSINAGYKVIAKGDVHVSETCEAVVIESGGDVYLKRGIKGGGKSLIKASGDVRASFMEGTHVEAGGDVIIQDYAFHCIINAGKSVKVLGKKGFIAGGKITAKNYLVTKRLGSDAAPRTEIYINSTEDFANSQHVIDRLAKLEEWLGKLDLIENDLTKLNSADQTQNPEETSLKRDQLEDQKTEIIRTIKKNYPDYEETARETEPFVGVLEVAHPNVLVCINNMKLMTKEAFERVKFVIRRYKVVMESFEPSNKINTN